MVKFQDVLCATQRCTGLKTALVVKLERQSATVIESDTQQANDNGCEECELVLLAKEPDKFQIFMVEAAKSAVIDTACTKTVGGVHWFNSYVDSLDEEQRKKVQIIESNNSFKFGDGRQVKSQKRARIPAQIGDKSCLIEMEIVNPFTSANRFCGLSVMSSNIEIPENRFARFSCRLVC